MTPFDHRPLIEGQEVWCRGTLEAVAVDGLERPFMVRWRPGSSAEWFARTDLAAHTDAQAARIKELEEALREIAEAKPWVGDNADFGSGHDMAREWASGVAGAALEPRS